MKIIFSYSFIKKAGYYNITIDDITSRIDNHFHSCTLLCSPLPDTNAYKGYYSGVERIIMFHVTTTGIIYPVHIGDKHDAIAKNITTSLVKKHTSQWLHDFLFDIEQKKYYIRHIRLKNLL